MSLNKVNLTNYVYNAHRFHADRMIIASTMSPTSLRSSRDDMGLIQEIIAGPPGPRSPRSRDRVDPNPALCPEVPPVCPLPPPPSPTGAAPALILRLKLFRL